MTKRELPKPKKSLKSFILEEDAKIIDKSASKIAIALSLISFSVLTQIENSNAFSNPLDSHSDNSIHTNNIYEPTPYNTKDLINLGNEDTNHHYEKVGKVAAVNKVSPSKSLSIVHGNHYNHGDSSSGWV